MAPSRAGTLGVEGIDTEKLYSLLLPFSKEGQGRAVAEDEAREPVTKLDFYEDGLSGGDRASEMRDAIAEAAGLPHGMSANALLTALNVIMSREEYKKLVSETALGNKQ